MRVVFVNFFINRLIVKQLFSFIHFWGEQKTINIQKNPAPTKPGNTETISKEPWGVTVTAARAALDTEEM